MMRSNTDNQTWLILGLGNPGPEYTETRHNIGFMAIESIAHNHQISGKHDKKLRAIIGTGRLENQPVILAQPTTYMNLSGEALQAIMKYYRISADHLIVIYDEAALPFGKLRIRPDGSAAGHNGIKSLIQHLDGSQTFTRIRIGIGTPTHPEFSLKDYVLARFSDQEKSIMPRLLETVELAVQSILTDTVANTMSRFNGFDLMNDPA